MHPFSVLTLGIFVAGYITARWDLVTRLYELAIFAWDHGVVVRLSNLGLTAAPPATAPVAVQFVLNDIADGPMRRHEPRKAFCFFPSSFSSSSCRSITSRPKRVNW